MQKASRRVLIDRIILKVREKSVDWCVNMIYVPAERRDLNEFLKFFEEEENVKWKFHHFHSLFHAFLEKIPQTILVRKLFSFCCFRKEENFANKTKIFVSTTTWSKHFYKLKEFPWEHWRTFTCQRGLAFHARSVCESIRILLYLSSTEVFNIPFNTNALNL